MPFAAAAAPPKASIVSLDVIATVDCTFVTLAPAITAAKTTPVTAILRNDRNILKLTILYQRREVAHDWRKVEFDG
jgi:hypothetical protein